MDGGRVLSGVFFGTIDGEEVAGVTIGLIVRDDGALWCVRGEPLIEVTSQLLIPGHHVLLDRLAGLAVEVSPEVHERVQSLYALVVQAD